MKRLALLVGLLLTVTPAYSQKQPISATSPDGKLMASALDRIVKVSDVGTQKTQMSLSAHQAKITGLAFSPDGKLLGSVDAAGKLNVIDTSSGKLVLTRGTEKGATGLTFADKGKTIEVKAGNKTRKFDVSTGKEKQ